LQAIDRARLERLPCPRQCYALRIRRSGAWTTLEPHYGIWEGYPFRSSAKIRNFSRSIISNDIAPRASHRFVPPASAP
jgi:hypothetical protein